MSHRIVIEEPCEFNCSLLSDGKFYYWPDESQMYTTELCPNHAAHKTYSIQGGSRQVSEGQEVWYCKTHKFMAAPARSDRCYYQQLNASTYNDRLKDGSCDMVRGMLAVPKETK